MIIGGYYTVTLMGIGRCITLFLSIGRKGGIDAARIRRTLIIHVP
jgi:hypothetical protein